MKKALCVMLAAIMLTAVFASCSLAPTANVSANIRTTSSAAADAAAWLAERLGEKLRNSVVIGTDAADYGVNVDTLEDDGYFIRTCGGEDVLFAKTPTGLDRAVRKYAKMVEAEAVTDVTYHEGYRVKRITVAERDISEFTIYSPDEGSILAAANELSALIARACGVTLAVSTGEPSAPAIVLEYVHDEALGNVGHRFDVSGDVVTISCSDAYTSQSADLAVRRFLEKTLGWMGLFFGFEDLPAADIVDISDGFKLEESVAFEYVGHCSSQHVKYESLPRQGGGYGLRMLSCHGMQGSRFAGDLSTSNDKNWAGDQPCWLSDEFYESAREDIVAYITAWPTVKFIDVAHGDNSNWCRCKECSKLYRSEGSTHAAEVLTWVNKLSEDLNETYPGIYYGVFAYEMTKKPPKTIRPNEHVYITFCYDRSCSSHSLDGKDCTTLDNWAGDHSNPNLSSWLEQWLSFTKNIYVWYYGLHNDLSTMSFLHTVRDDLRYLRDVGVKGIYWEAHEAGFSANWVAYCLHSELVWNVDMSDEEYDALYERLLRTFYGDAAPLMREYLDVLGVIHEHGQCVACWSGLVPGGWKQTNVNNDLYAERYDLLYDLIERAVAKADSFAEQRRLEYIACNCIYVGSLSAYPKAQAAHDEARCAELCERYAKIDAILTKYGMDMTDKDTITNLWAFDYPRTLPEVFQAPET